MKKRMSELEALRRSAGIYTQLKESEKSKIKTLDIETSLLNSFNSLIENLRNVKERISTRFSDGNSTVGYRQEYKFVDETKKLDKEYLYNISNEKLELIKKIIDELFKGEDDEE